MTAAYKPSDPSLMKIDGKVFLVLEDGTKWELHGNFTSQTYWGKVKVQQIKSLGNDEYQIRFGWR